MKKVEQRKREIIRRGRMRKREIEKEKERRGNREWRGKINGSGK